METLRLIFLFLHFIGLASLLGGGLAQLRASSRQVSRAMMDGAWAMLVTGLVLVGLNEPGVNHAKIGLKLVVLVVILGILLANRRRALAAGAFWGVTGLAALNVAIAVFWTGGSS